MNYKKAHCCCFHIDRRGFSLIELVILVMIVGIFAAVSVPRLNYAVIRKKKAEAAAKELVFALQRCRSLAVTNASQNKDGFALVMTGPNPYTGWEISDLSDSDTIETYNLDGDVTCTGDRSLSFGPLGNLTSGENGQVNVSGEGVSVDITVTAPTGMVSWSQ